MSSEATAASHSVEERAVNNFTTVHSSQSLQITSADLKSFKSRPDNQSEEYCDKCMRSCPTGGTIIDKLLTRMYELENERAELLAANRTWAVQCQTQKDQYQHQIKMFEKKLSKYTSQASREGSTMMWNEARDQINLLSHQAQVYREDFMEERKARVRAHAQLEALRNELKRERKSRAKLATFVSEARNVDDLPNICN